MDYTIKKGDTLNALSKKFGVTTQELAKSNGIKDPNVIYAGKALHVPDGNKTSVFAPKTENKPAQNQATNPITNTTPQAISTETAKVDSQVEQFNKFTAGEGGKEITYDEHYFDSKDPQVRKESYIERTNSFAQKQIDVDDKDGDKKLNFDEFYSKEKENYTKQRDEYEAKTKAEFEAGNKAQLDAINNSPLPDEQKKQLISQMGLDKPVEVASAKDHEKQDADFKASMEAYYKKLDANGDGIDSAEMAGMIAKADSDDGVIDGKMTLDNYSALQENIANGKGDLSAYTGFFRK